MPLFDHDAPPSEVPETNSYSISLHPSEKGQIPQDDRGIFAKVFTNSDLLTVEVFGVNDEGNKRYIRQTVTPDQLVSVEKHNRMKGKEVPELNALSALEYVLKRVKLKPEKFKPDNARITNGEIENSPDQYTSPRASNN